MSRGLKESVWILVLGTFLGCGAESFLDRKDHSYDSVFTIDTTVEPKLGTAGPLPPAIQLTASIERSGDQYVAKMSWIPGDASVARWNIEFLADLDDGSSDFWPAAQWSLSAPKDPATLKTPGLDKGRRYRVLISGSDMGSESWGFATVGIDLRSVR